MNTDASTQWANPHEGSTFQRVAKLAGLTLVDWQIVEPRLPKGPEGMQLLSELLKRSARTDTVLFCFDDMVVLLHEGHISAHGYSMHSRATRERIQGKNEVVDPSARLSTEELMSIFVMLEALVYKIVHIVMEQQRKSYNQ